MPPPFKSEEQRPFVSICAQYASCISPGRTRLVLLRYGMAVAIVATAAAIHLHLISFTSAGGLWRDEVLVRIWPRFPHYRLCGKRCRMIPFLFYFQS